jgi:hypothetical protein
MVFTGDWNGGERVFRIAPGQHLTFERLAQLDPPWSKPQPGL